MKKYYKFGELILMLREEYMECKKLLDELNTCINVKSENISHYFTGNLSERDDRDAKKIKLVVEKRYLNILKKIQLLKYGIYSEYLYKALFISRKEGNGFYKLDYNNQVTPFENKKYIPDVEIIEQDKFSMIIDELFSSDLMQLNMGVFKINNDLISLDFDNAFISSQLGYHSILMWNGISDSFQYSIAKGVSPSLIGDIFSLQIPADEISDDWLNLLEKHENDFNKDLFFDVDIKANSKKGILKLSSIDNASFVRLLKK